MLIYVTIDTNRKTISVSEENKDVYFDYPYNENFTSISVKDIIEDVEKGE